MNSDADDAPGGEAERLQKEYRVQAEGLGMVAESGLLERLLPEFSDDGAALKKRAKKAQKSNMAKRFASGTGFIHANHPDPEWRELLMVAHVAACCVLFADSVIPTATLNRRGMVEFAQQLLMREVTDKPGQTSAWIDRLHRADAVRTIQILRLLGLVSTSSGSARQLSFATGSGSRDIGGLHMRPELAPSAGTIEFSEAPGRPEHIVLIDNGPEFADYFDKLNHTHSKWLMAMNTDIDQALSALVEATDRGGFKPRNLVAGLRIDHLMIPDVAGFFRQILPVIAPASDLIITVGAGHTLAEFEGRIAKMQELYDFLKAVGLDPTRIKLYHGETPELCRKQPSFGQLSFTTYEILYCRLKKKALEKTL